MLNSSESLSQKFIRKGFWLYFFTFILGPMGYAIKVMLSRDLSVEEVGMFYGIISFISLIAIYNDLGCTESLNYTLPKLIVKNDYPRAKYIFLLTAKVQLSSSLIIIALLYTLSSWLEREYFHAPIRDVLSIGLLFFLGINITHLSTIFFSVAQDTKYQKITEFVRMSITTIGVALLFFSDLGNTYNYMVIWIIGVFSASLFSSIFAYIRYYRPFFQNVITKKDIKERNNFLKYSLGTLVTANIATVLGQIDMQLIIVFLDQASVGYYSNYLSLIGLPFLIISPIVGFLLPVISELSGRGATEKIKTITREFSRAFMMISVWSSIFFLQFGTVISIVFFGEKFRESGIILQYAAPFIFFNFLNQIAFQILSGTGNIRKRIHILLITLGINIPLTLILIHSELHVRGAALAVGISWIPLWYMSYRATREYQSPFDIKLFFRNIIGASLAYFILLLLSGYLILSPLPLFLIAIFGYLSIFLLINKRMLKDFIAMIRASKMPPTDTNNTPLSSL